MSFTGINTPVKVLTPLGQGSFDYANIISSTEDNSHILINWLSYLREIKFDCDFIYFYDIKNNWRLINKEKSDNIYGFYWNSFYYERFYIPIMTSLEEYLGTLDKAASSRYRLFINKLSQKGELWFYEDNSARGIETFIDCYIRQLTPNNTKNLFASQHFRLLFQKLVKTKNCKLLFLRLQQKVLGAICYFQDCKAI